MAITATAPTPIPMIAGGFRPHRLTIEQDRRMVEAGIVTENEPIFLWHGQLVEQMTKGPDHSNALTDLYALLVRLVPDGWHVRQERMMEVGDDGAPEPDLTVIRGATCDYRGCIPKSQDVALVVEVADSSSAIDSGEVLETYVAQAILLYGIVDLPKRRLDNIYSRPSGPAEAPFPSTLSIAATARMTRCPSSTMAARSAGSRCGICYPDTWEGSDAGLTDRNKPDHCLECPSAVGIQFALGAERVLPQA
ncbi:MAG: Uma2 family endonuclease [Isosphaeraceae bacterium]|nr:Uma2 family endonuclease [Isosphaeraceae bacterium]